jgi:hypothetical protein
VLAGVAYLIARVSDTSWLAQQFRLRTQICRAGVLIGKPRTLDSHSVLALMATLLPSTGVPASRGPKNSPPVR